MINYRNKIKVKFYCIYDLVVLHSTLHYFCEPNGAFTDFNALGLPRTVLKFRSLDLFEQMLLHHQFLRPSRFKLNYELTNYSFPVTYNNIKSV